MSRRRKIWLAGLGIALVLIFVAAVFFSRWMNSSSDGSISVGAPTGSDTSARQPVAIKTSYFTTTLPAGFSVKRSTETPAGDPRLQLTATTSGLTGQQFSVAIGPLPAGGLKELGDYHLRSTQITTYAPYSPTGLPAGGAAFKNIAGSPGFVAFWPHGNLYTEVALNSDGQSSLEQLQAVFAGAMSGWKWQ